MGLCRGSFPSPIGLLTAIVDGGGALKHFYFGRLEHPMACEDPAAIATVRAQVDEYFAGERRVFDLELAPEGTDFQREVWRGLATIPFGRTLSYGALAERIGYPTASRAVGAANGANPIALILPCHRVVAADGRLTGFGGGIRVKAALLAHEGALSPVLALNADRHTKIWAQDQPALL
jgi:methylated-DNA-[protein]-cysteine S-methyltransferase